MACGAGLLPCAAAAQAGLPAGTAPPAETTRRIVVVPPLQWDSAMGTFRNLYHQAPSDLGRLTGGILFGMKPQEVNGLLPVPVRGVTWTALPLATEFSEDVRYFWIKLTDARDLRAGLTSCVGDGSYLVFLFRSRGLFRVSYRLTPDRACPSVEAAATDVLAQYAPLGSNVAISTHYRNGSAEVVDIVDPAAGHLIPIRWQTRRR